MDIRETIGKAEDIDCEEDSRDDDEDVPQRSQYSRKKSKMLNRGRKLVAACLKNHSPPEDLITLADLEELPSLLQSDVNIDRLAEFSAIMPSEQTLENPPSTTNSNPENDSTIILSKIPPSAPSTSAINNNENTGNDNLQVLEAEDNTDFSSDDSVQDPNFQPNDSPEILWEISNQQRIRAKRGRSDKSQWMYEQQKNKRMKGEGYLGRRKNEEGKIVYDVQKAPKEMKPRCEHNKNAKFFECYKLSDDSRLQIFKQFWLLNREAKRCFVTHLY
ncbi:unnamed protein product [Parnassius mnemosyne]|uniref:Uncharacterized protein n=1 Tax=Parnassius mnemosyne TaxID=213953 RepID=A0AAV1LW65_9NEOP